MSSAADTIRNELSKIPLIDPHSHVNPHSPASTNLFDLLGYHYYTELAHSAGLPVDRIQDTAADQRERTERLFSVLPNIDNTVQWSWMLQLANDLFDWSDDYLGPDNWQGLYDRVIEYGQRENRADEVLQRSGVEQVFLTNDFDDALEGFDTHKYVPCLRTDDLVFHLASPSVRTRLERAGKTDLSTLKGLDEAVENLFVHFTSRGAKACAISLPPTFAPRAISYSDAAAVYGRMQKEGDDTAAEDRQTMANWMFWRLARGCREHALPFDLMIGVNRKVYPAGVHQGQDLYDSRVSLIQYAELFNAYPDVVFPISVLASVTNQELTDYAWIFPNVVTNGHWWYSNTPSIIRHDLAMRLEAIPRSKQIGYYSDAYKVEFILPKYNMYRRILAETLADEFVAGRGWTEQKAIELGHQVLRGNIERIFMK